MKNLRCLLTCSLLALSAACASAQPSHAAPAASGPARPAITGVAFIRVYETNPEGATHFYRDTLGFLPVKGANGDTRYTVNAQQWVETIDGASPNPNDRLAAVGFTTRNAAAMQAYLKARGVSIEQPLHDGEFSVRDPEGNLVVFVQQGSQKLPGTPSPHATSHRIIHVGFIVEDRAKEDAFWRDTLGFRMYWHGTGKDGTAGDDYVSQQVPEGTDWLEYMLHQPKTVDLRMHGVMNHFSLGVADMQTAVAALKANGCTDADCSKTQMGRDGKVQLNVYDPDRTRVEFMEFTPRGTPCCSPITGPAPTEVENR